MEESKFDLVLEIAEWNEQRLNTEYNKKLEYRMLLEEVDEYLGAKTYVDQADAIADIIFVAIGSMYKLTGDVDMVYDIMNVVCAANNQKGKAKDADGKIKKPMGFVPPEEMIEKILFRKDK
jgi:predicted HAD superfamily Cof-like phosphohydrolase